MMWFDINVIRLRRQEHRECPHRFFAYRPVYAEDCGKRVWLKYIWRISFKREIAGGSDFFENAYFISKPSPDYFAGRGRDFEPDPM